MKAIFLWQIGKALKTLRTENIPTARAAEGQSITAAIDQAMNREKYLLEALQEKVRQHRADPLRLMTALLPEPGPTE